MKNKVIEVVTFFYFTIFLILMLNLVIKTIYATLPLEDYSMYVYISGGVGLLLYIASKIKNFKFNKYEIIVFIMILLSCLSLINAIDINVAIFGKANRYEGLLVWLSYYIFILNAMNIKNKKYVYVITLLISVHMLSNIVYGLYQVGIFDYSNSNILIVSPASSASGFLGNLMFFGSLSCIFYGIVLGMFVKLEMGIKKYLLGVLLLIANLGVIMNCSMSAIVGIIIVNVVCLIQIIIAIIKKRKKAFVYLGSLLAGILSFVLVFYVYSIDRPTIKNDVIKLFDETKSVVVDNKVDDKYGTSRIYIWRKTLEKLDEVPLTGVGIDNFRNFNIDPIETKTHVVIVDKAHNDYLQKAVCEGIISGIVFVVFLLMVFFKGVFSKLSPIYYGLFLAFIGYSVQAFFNISFINVAPIYFIIVGLIIGKLTQKESIV